MDARLAQTPSPGRGPLIVQMNAAIGGPDTPCHDGGGRGRSLEGRWSQIAAKRANDPAKT